MGEESANRNRSRESRSSRPMEGLSLETNSYPRDLLQRFVDTQQYRRQAFFERKEHEEVVAGGRGAEEKETGDIELNLGLSLGGRFGVDKTPNKLTRSSSIIGITSLARDHSSDAAFSTTSPPFGSVSSSSSSYPVLMRTSSLPAETEEEWRKRKEIQSLRRMEAKRRRSEKLRNSSASSNWEDERRNLAPSTTLTRQFGVGAVGVTRCNNLQQQHHQRQGSQGSVESQGGSSSGLSEMESKPFQGPNSGGETRSPGTSQLLQDRINQEAAGSSSKTPSENLCGSSRRETGTASDNLDPSGTRGMDMGLNAMENMPSVSTKGEGPNGRRVDGILYKYGKGQEVRIMCVCHGSFLSPADFVKHAGGGDVDHPLRHIVINPSGISSFS